MLKDEEGTTVPSEPLKTERPEFPMLLRVVGMFSLVLCALTVYFAGVAEYVDETAVAAADLVLVPALRIVAGACAISGFAIGLFVLTRRDEAIMRAQQAARDAQRLSV